MAKTLSLNDVAGYLRRAEKTSLLLGAGASKSAGIPLAGELMREIHEKYGHCLSGLSDKERTNYGTVMGALDPNQRKQLLSPYLEQDNLHKNPSLSYTNWGHIALAHLLGRTNGHRHSSITRVLSCNFDALLERSLGLLGDHLPLYDFGISPTDHLTDLAEPAIFHLHGQGYGLRMLNSDDDTQEHKEKLRPLLRDSLHHHLMLVMGYSGEADTIFDIIKEDYNDHSTLIWLGYDKTMPERLQTFFEGKKYAHYVGGCSFDETMFELTHRVSDNWPPALLIDPLQHAASLVQHIPPFPDLPAINISPFDLLSRMQTAQEEWQAKYQDENAEIKAFLSGAPVSLEEPLPSEAEALSIRARRLTGTGFRKAQEALTLPNKEEREHFFKEAERFFETAVEVGGVATYFTYAIWGVTLRDMALIAHTTNEKQTLLLRAIEKCEKAHELNPKHARTLELWASTLRDMTQNTHNTDEKQALFSQAAEKYEKVHKLDPKNLPTLRSWAAMLSATAQNIHNTDEQKELLFQAIEKCEKARELNPREILTLKLWDAILDQLTSLPLTDEQRRDVAQQRAALEAAQKAHDPDPKDSQTLRSRARTLRDLARKTRSTHDKQELFFQAAEKCEKAYELNPRNSHTLILWDATLNQLTSLPLTDEQRRDVAQQWVALEAAKETCCLLQQEEGEEKETE